MSWFFLALIAPILWSISNHIDKFLISRYFKGDGVGSLVIFSAIFSLFVLPVAFFFEPNSLSINPIYATALVINSIFWVTGLIFYLYAIQKDEASMVVPIFQTIPVFGYFLAYIILEERLTPKQILASLLIIAGAISLSLDLNQERVKIKGKILVLMLMSSFLAALGGVVFKLIALKSNFWMSTFWNQLGIVLVGFFLLVFVKPYKTEFIRIININRVSVLGINSLNELISIIAGLAMSYAFLLAPITLVWVVGGFQPFFVFLFGVILTLFFPNLGSESLIKKHIIQKIVAILVIFIGIYFLHT